MLVIGTTEGVFLKAAEGSPRASDLSSRDVKVLRRTNGHVLAGTNDGVYRSADGGGGWQRVGLEGQEVLEVMPAPADPKTVYAGTVPAALFRSRDGGSTWAAVDSFTQAFDPDTWGLPAIAGWPTGARAHAIVVDPRDSERCVVGIEVGGIASSAERGSRWATTLPGGVPDIHYVVADPGRPERLYCSTGFGRIGKLAEVPDRERIAGMFTSDDGGQSWRYIWDGMLHRYTRPLCIDPRPPHAVTVGTAPSARPYITYRIEGGAHGQVYQTNDGGATWRPLGDAPHSPSVAAILCVTPALDAPGNVLVGTDLGEVWHVEADKTRWTLLADRLPPVQSVLNMD
ncbi:MAG: hypothetical protein JO352_21985 [Chloroflexi bacterium]|nr:hypothetical protein [Chloroflexota bacterium]MBV9597887.1 hypothetical protein [Chloroflexota bacterium]